jgi:hypothetical protein
MVGDSRSAKPTPVGGPRRQSRSRRVNFAPHVYLAASRPYENTTPRSVGGRRRILSTRLTCIYLQTSAHLLPTTMGNPAATIRPTARCDRGVIVRGPVLSRSGLLRLADMRRGWGCHFRHDATPSRRSLTDQQSGVHQGLMTRIPSFLGRIVIRRDGASRTLWSPVPRVAAKARHRDGF